MIGTLKDYTQSVKEHVPEGKNKSLWEEFFTGTTSQYQTLTQQTQDVYAYDISSAYANYKQQQLQLQMNQQLGEGFKQQLGTQLQSQYGSAFADIKSQEASALSKVNTEYLKDIAEGEEKFAKIGKQVKQLDKLVQEYDATKTTKTAPLGDIYETKTDTHGVETKTLTEAGRLWYYKAMDEKFQDWLLSDANPSDISAEDREAIVEQLRGENAMLFKEAVGGIGSWDDIKAQEIENKLLSQQRNEAIKNTNAALDNRGSEFKNIYGDYSKLTTEQINTLTENVNRTNNYVSSVNTNETIGLKNKKVVDEYGNNWVLTSNNWTYTPGQTGGDKDAKNIGKKLGLLTDKGWINKDSKNKAGDIVYVDGSYYVITSFTSKSIGVRKLAPQ